MSAGESTRPLSVTIVGGVYVLAGAIGFAAHLGDFRAHPYGTVWVELVRLAAVVAGVCLLRGRNWARWLALAWIALHVVLSAFHSLPELAMHSLICAILAWLLLRAPAARYFRPAGTSAA